MMSQYLFSPARSASPSARRIFLRQLLYLQEFACPKLLKGADPSLIDLADGHYIQRIHPLSSGLARVNQLSLPQHLEMLHHAEASHLREPLDDLGGGAGTVAQKIQDRPPRSVR